MSPKDPEPQVFKAAVALLEQWLIANPGGADALLQNAFYGRTPDPRGTLAATGEPHNRATQWVGQLLTAAPIDGHHPLALLLTQAFEPQQEPSCELPGGYPALLAALDQGIRPAAAQTPTTTAPRLWLKLPAGAEHFLGRTQELKALNTAWSSGPKTAIVELIAPGGTGKTALVKRWLDALRDKGWRGAGQVFAWSFYSQGTDDRRQASEDLFLATAIEWLGLAIDAAANPADKGRALAEALLARPSLLVLDGLEPLQYPPGPLAGELRAPGLRALLTQLAACGQPGLCLITSREWLSDLGEWVRSRHHPRGTVQRIDLGNLSRADGARLLHARGAERAGAVAIQAQDAELQAAAAALDGHALSLSLLGRYIAQTQQGDIRRRDQIDLVAADAAQRGHAAKVVAAYETWFAQAGRERELAALRLLGLFDRPAGGDLLAALRAAPAIAGLTEPLQDLSAAEWHLTLTNLQDAGLAQADADGSLDAHPLVREHLAASLQRRAPAAFQAGHRRLYHWLRDDTEHRPSGLAGLQPLYQALAHGCQAGLHQEALHGIYVDRILRGTGNDGFYSGSKLGAFGADLGALAWLFAEPWTRPLASLAEGDQAWLLNAAAIQLRALGRLAEALGPMRAGAELRVKQQAWKNAAISYGNLSELQLGLGRLGEALADARRAVGHADQSRDAFQRMSKRTALADALHQHGEGEAAAAAFAEAEAIQAERQPQYPMLYSLQGFLYCDLLLAEAERAAWALGLGADGGAGVAVANQAAMQGSTVRTAAGVAPAAGPDGLEAGCKPALPGVDQASGRDSTGRMAAGVAPAAGPSPGRLGRRKEAQQAACDKAPIVGPPVVGPTYEGKSDEGTLISACAEAQRRALGAQRAWREIFTNDCSLLDEGLDHLTLARAALYQALLRHQAPDGEARHQAEQALDRLRASGRSDIVPLGLLTRAQLHQALGDPAAARADLDDAQRLAERGGMRLHLADIALHRARLFHDRAALGEARRLIDACAYHRRLPELEAAEAAAERW